VSGDGDINSRVVRVETGSRLHFGLFDPHGVSGRQFGGAGMMIEAPPVVIELRRARPPYSKAPIASIASRTSQLAERLSTGLDLGADCGIDVQECPDEHLGLGTGTQLGLAIAAGFVRLHGLDREPCEIVALSGRGERSAIGTHGFAHGGFLIDGGKAHPAEVSPIVARHDVPEHWRVVLVMARLRKGISGEKERETFRELGPVADDHVDRLCRIALLGMLPALAAGDIDTFGEALHEFGRRAGVPFREAQGGVFASTEAAEVAAFLRHEGIRGVGQSSWGPTLYAVTESEDRARWVWRMLQDRFGLDPTELAVAAPRNHGATCADLKA
jgi:beta-RFAP synthase